MRVRAPSRSAVAGSQNAIESMDGGSWWLLESLVTLSLFSDGKIRMFRTGGIPALPSKWLGPSQIEARVKTTFATNFLPFSWMVHTAYLLDGGQTDTHKL
ncbi:hypothetical protein PVAP13_3NG291841 [Panicum virgatum]|uniref:Uncharacterized protein n=1 Tax=Panicum virgatum TaxID=38727 RepID=A0A8T0UBE6_PANVG|nr:hypothetical protein PVAP13_3NG291841 [Panicum virgatum]